MKGTPQANPSRPRGSNRQRLLAAVDSNNKTGIQALQNELQQAVQTATTAVREAAAKSPM
jgi:hypothetical protein